MFNICVLPVHFPTQSHLHLGHTRYFKLLGLLLLGLIGLFRGDPESEESFFLSSISRELVKIFLSKLHKSVFQSSHFLTKPCILRSQSAVPLV